MTRVVKSAIALLAVSAAARPSDVVRRDDDLDCSPESGNINNPDCPLFTWGSIGDSYSSGVAYNEDVEFDGNRDGCLRINQAYSALMIQDTSWTVGQQAPVFNGCSGSRLVDMHGNGNTGRQLINRLSPLSTVVLMQAGGNVRSRGNSKHAMPELTIRDRIVLLRTLQAIVFTSKRLTIITVQSMLMIRTVPANAARQSIELNSILITLVSTA